MYSVQTEVIVNNVGTLTGGCSIDYQISSGPDDPDNPTDDEDEGIIDKIKDIPGDVKDKIVDGVDWVKDKLGGGGGALKDGATAVWNKSKEVAKKVYDTGKDVVKTIYEKGEDVVTTVYDYITEDNPISDWLGGTILGTLGKYIPIILFLVGGLIVIKVIS